MFDISNVITESVQFFVLKNVTFVFIGCVCLQRGLKNWKNKDKQPTVLRLDNCFTSANESIISFCLVLFVFIFSFFVQLNFGALCNKQNASFRMFLKILKTKKYIVCEKFIFNFCCFTRNKQNSIVLVIKRLKCYSICLCLLKNTSETT